MDQGAKQQEVAAGPAEALTGHRFLPTRTGVIELVILFAALFLVDRLFFPPGEFAKLEPHPFWLPVILLSLQYGTADGLLAAAAAIVVGLLVGWPSQGVGEEYYRYVIRVWSVPIGWLVSAIVIGEIRSRQRGQMIALDRELLTTRTQAEVITSHCHRLEEKIARLEREFATIDAGSLDSLVTSFPDLRRGDIEAWHATLGRVHRGLVGSGCISLVLRDGNVLVRVAQTVMANNPSPARVAPPAAVAHLIERVMSTRRPLNALRADEAAILDGIAAMAMPLVAEPGGRVIGVLLLESVDPSRLTFDTESRLDLLAREVVYGLSLRGYDDLIAAGAATGLVSADAAGRLQEAAPSEAVGRRLGLLPRLGRV